MGTTSSGETATKPQPRGFAAVPNWLVLDSDVSAHEKLVYLVLSSMIGAQGSWFTEHKTIAASAGISESSVQRALKALQERGIVDWRPRYHPNNPKIRLGNAYRITVDTLGLSDWGVVSERHQGGVSVTEKNKNPEEEHTQQGDDDGFAAIWVAWPNGNSRKAALSRWSRLSLKQRSEILPKLIAHANAHRQHTPPQYIPMLVTWLNQERWDDPLPVSRERGAYKPEPQAPSSRRVIPQGHVPVRDDNGQIIGSKPA